jgi:PAS domain S-box-containing protein
MKTTGGDPSLLKGTGIDAAVELDLERRIVGFSPAAETMFGHRREEVAGRFLAEVIVPLGLRADLERYLAAGEARTSGERIELSALRKDGTAFPIELSVIVTSHDGKSRLLGLIRDISERKESEHFRLLVEVVEDYEIFMLDPAGRVATWNAGAQAFSGYTPAEVLGQRFSIFYTADGRAQGKPERELEIAGHTGRFEEEGWRVRKDGSEFWAHVLIKAIRSPAGNLLGFAKVTRDLTERRKAARLEEVEGRLKSQELEAENRRMHAANRLKSEFLANMSHELRTPLNAILGFAELMFKGKVGPVSPDHKEYLGDILNSARHLLQLINDVLDLSKIESGKVELRPEPVDLGKLVGEVRDILRGLAAAQRIRIEVIADEDALAAFLDPSKLKQALYNYLSNALKFTPEEGRVTVRISSQDPARIRIAVEDTGIGIRSEDLPRLFVEFQQLDAGMAKKYAGTGLGLSLTKRIVEAQGGEVGATSVPGKGSVFWLTLPRRASGVQAPEPPAQGAALASQVALSRTVVVIDDNPAALRLMEATLKTVGYAARGFANPADALRAIEELTPAVVVIDIVMPGIDAFALVHRLRALPYMNGVPIVVWTVKDVGEDERKDLLLAAQAIVPKGQGKSEEILRGLAPYLPGATTGSSDAR